MRKVQRRAVEVSDGIKQTIEKEESVSFSQEEIIGGD